MKNLQFLLSRAWLPASRAKATWVSFISALSAMSLVAGCSPPPKTPPAFPAASIAAGGAHTCSIGPAGGVACAGKNNYGQLGDGTTSTRYNPVAVPGLTGV